MQVGAETHRIAPGRLESIDHCELVSQGTFQVEGQLTEVVLWRRIFRRVVFAYPRLEPAPRCVRCFLKIIAEQLSQEGTGSAAALVHLVGRANKDQVLRAGDAYIEQPAFVDQMWIIDSRFAAGPQFVRHWIV